MTPSLRRSSISRVREPEDRRRTRSRCAGRAAARRARSPSRSPTGGTGSRRRGPGPSRGGRPTARARTRWSRDRSSMRSSGSWTATPGTSTARNASCSSNLSRVAHHAVHAFVELVLVLESSGERRVACVGRPRAVVGRADRRRRARSSRGRRDTRPQTTGRRRGLVDVVRRHRGRVATRRVREPLTSTRAVRSPCSRARRDRAGLRRRRYSSCRPTAPRRCGCGGSSAARIAMAMKLPPWWSMYE